jgi:hypothetical protein
MPLYMFIHNLLNVLVQIADIMGLQKNLLPHSSTFTIRDGDYIGLWCSEQGLRGIISDE